MSKKEVRLAILDAVKEIPVRSDHAAAVFDLLQDLRDANGARLVFFEYELSDLMLCLADVIASQRVLRKTNVFEPDYEKLISNRTQALSALDAAMERFERRTNPRRQSEQITLQDRTP